MVKMLWSVITKYIIEYEQLLKYWTFEQIRNEEL